MTPSLQNTSIYKWLSIAFGSALLVSFFLPWVSWDEIMVSGYDMPAGNFFSIAETKFGLENPYPQLSFAFNVFWLIPTAAVAVIAFVFLKKNTLWPAAVAGLLSLSLVLVYFLFSKNMVDQLGVSKSVWTMTKPWLFIHILAAVAIVLSAGKGKWVLKSGLVLVTAAATIIGFNMASKQAQKKIFEEKFESTDNIKADYILSAGELIKEFMANDTAANKKYMEKMLEVNGTISSAELTADSIGTIRFEDSTGSYAIFSLEKNQYEKMKNIKAGDAVSVKGVCSGSMFSEILGKTSISFKRTTLYKQ